MKFEWQRINKPRNTYDNITERAKVFGGWIVRTCEINDSNTESTSESMVFIPDPNHEWGIGK